MFKKIINIGVALVIAVSICGCGNNSAAKYNAVMYSDTIRWFNEDFLKENMTFGASFNGEYFGDKSLPKSRTFVIKEQSEFNGIFTEFPPEVNFEKEMLLIYIFTIDAVLSYNIMSVKLDGSVIKLEYKLKDQGDKLTGFAPGPWCLIVKMDKLEITGAEFTRIK